MPKYCNQRREVYTLNTVNTSTKPLTTAADSETRHAEPKSEEENKRVTNLLEILGEGLQEGEQHIPGALPGVAHRRAKLPVVPGQEILPPAVTASEAVLLREPHHLDEHLGARTNGSRPNG